MFKFQEPAIMRFGFTAKFSLETAYNLQYPYFKVGDDWFFPSHQIGRLVHETKVVYLEEPRPRPTHYRNGFDGQEIEIPLDAFISDGVSWQDNLQEYLRRTP